ncbi:MAG: hypothetical protein ABSG76_11435 [Xanthobacteraceae bacterium]|jgi:hypothetical protein
MTRQHATAVKRPAATVSGVRADRPSSRRHLAPVIRELEAENAGLRDTVVGLALEVAALREQLPRGGARAALAARIEAARTGRAARRHPRAVS